MTAVIRPATAAAASVRTWSLRTRVGHVFVALLVLFAALLGTVTFFFVRFIDRGNDLIQHWQPAVSLSQYLLADLVNQESGLRGYAIGQQSGLLQPYDQFQTQESKDEAHLRALIASRPELVADVDAFVAAAHQWRLRVAEPVIALVEHRDQSALTALAGADSKHYFDIIRQRSAQLTSALEKVRDRAASDRRDAAVYVGIALGVMAGLVVVAFLLVWRGLRRSVLDPVERLATQTREVADGALGRKIEPYGPPELLALGADVDAMRARIIRELETVERSRHELETRSAELARSNADLEQFAYVASHDLSEPLRKVANFCQLLERQYGTQLDDKAKQYIGFAVDGAKRMQALIADLLAFSRVGRSTEQFTEVALEDCLTRALGNLDDRIRTLNARVSHTPLPRVSGDPTLLTALFQNLVGNALKYHGDREPWITVSAACDGQRWTIDVSDNGIGIDPQYAERVFVIFQRLHLRDEYEGTGIGLALCRRIVEFHGGTIRLSEREPGSGPGATVSFSLPALPELSPVSEESYA